MSKHVLIVATCYDTASRYIYEWAKALHEDLLANSSCGSCLMLDGESLYCSGSNFGNAIERVDYVVFYGHGKPDQWIALPAGRSSATVPLVDSGSVRVLDGRQIYAACCHSLTILGRAFGTIFANRKPLPEFVGYDGAFDFSIQNRDEFRKIVNDSVRDFILGSTPAATIVYNQRVAWDNLRKAFSPGGSLQTYPDAIFAASAARSNALAIV
jgi:hypothetical protein